jgi:hypothetical protein
MTRITLPEFVTDEQPDRVRIRPLQWHCCSIPAKAAPGDWHVCRSIVGLYEIHVFDLPAHEGTAFLSVPNGTRMSEHPSVIAAEQAAQVDFERRIMEVIL